MNDLLKPSESSVTGTYAGAIIGYNPRIQADRESMDTIAAKIVELRESVSFLRLRWAVIPHATEKHYTG